MIKTQKREKLANERVSEKEMIRHGRAGGTKPGSGETQLPLSQNDATDENHPA